MNEIGSQSQNMDSALRCRRGSGWVAVVPGFGTMQVHSPTPTMPARRHCHWTGWPRPPRLVTYRYANGPLSGGPQPATHHSSSRSHYWHSASRADRGRLWTLKSWNFSAWRQQVWQRLVWGIAMTVSWIMNYVDMLGGKCTIYCLFNMIYWFESGY